MDVVRKRKSKARVLILMTIAVVFGAFGDVSISRGMKLVAAGTYSSVGQMLLSVLNIYVVGGVVLLAAFLVMYSIALSWEDLSYVLPLTAADYVLVTLLAYFLIHEDVSPLRWAGSVLVALGIALVART